MLEMEELTVQIVLTEAKDGVELRDLAKNGVLMSVLSLFLLDFLVKSYIMAVLGDLQLS